MQGWGWWLISKKQDSKGCWNFFLQHDSPAESVHQPQLLFEPEETNADFND